MTVKLIADRLKIKSDQGADGLERVAVILDRSDCGWHSTIEE
ncbi:MAG: hypothetical protein AAGK79_16650 [Pseudomonadota bacterium]